MTDAHLREWASKAASEIVKREGAALALSVRDGDQPAIEADSNLLGIAIAQAIIEAYRAGELFALSQTYLDVEAYTLVAAPDAQVRLVAKLGLREHEATLQFRGKSPAHGLA